MIGLLRGRIARADPEAILLDVQGVGYAVRIPLSTYYEVERLGKGAEVELLIHTQVREDAIELFGFWTEEEKGLFERLIGVSGIGPRLAQVILSGMAPADLLSALAAGDVPQLVRIPGIGKKTAERMVLELRDGARAMLGEQAAERPRQARPLDDLVAALLNLGYRRAEAERTATAVCQEMPEAELSALLRASLKRLSRL